jgi:hypothetical protein
MPETPPIQVIDLAEHDGAFKEVAKDMESLRKEVKESAERTNLSLDQRKDDLVKYVGIMEGIQKEIERVGTEVETAKKLARMSSGSKGLSAEVKHLGAGFKQPAGSDDDYQKILKGKKPSLKNLVEGVRLKSGEFFTPNHEDIIELQRLHDDCVLTSAIKMASEGQQFMAEGGMKSLEIHEEFLYRAEAIQKADADLIDTTDLTNWVPTHFTTQIYELMKIGLPELGVFQEITMTGKNMDLNIDLTDEEADLIAEKVTIATASPFADLNAQPVTDAKVTLAAKKLRARVLTSAEAEEDSIVALLPLIKRKLVRNMQEALADAIINGDEGGDLDTSAATTHFGKANPAAGVDARVAWDGLRSFALDNTATPTIVSNNGDAALTAAILQTAQSPMQEFGVDPSNMAWILGIIGYLELLADAQVATMEKIGDRAIILRGMLAAVNGVPIIVSRRIPNNCGVSGFMDNVTTDKTVAICVNREGAILGNRRRMTFGQDVYGATDTRDLFAFWRGDFEDLFGNAKPWLAYVRNVNT